MKSEFELSVDFNGLVIFDYPGIKALFGEVINSGDNILNLFTTTNKGDEVLDEGLALPIMGVDDGGYKVRFFVDEEPEINGRVTIFSDQFFYLNVQNTLYVADISVFWDWENYTGWIDAGVPKGHYKVSVTGVKIIDGSGSVDYGYDIVMYSVADRFLRTSEPRSNSNVIL